MDRQCMGMCSEAVYGPAVYGYVLRSSIWTCCECVCVQGQFKDLQCMAHRQYMDQQCMGVCSGAMYGPAVYGYVFRGNIWTCSVWVCSQRQYMGLQCISMCSEAVY